MKWWHICRIWTDYEKTGTVCFRRPKAHWEQHQSLPVITQLLHKGAFLRLHFFHSQWMCQLFNKLKTLWFSLIGTSRSTLSKSPKELLESGRERYYSKNASPSFQRHNRNVSGAIPSDTPEGNIWRCCCSSANSSNLQCSGKQTWGDVYRPLFDRLDIKARPQRDAKHVFEGPFTISRLTLCSERSRTRQWL